MMHTIRLRKPWHRFCDQQPTADRVDVPDPEPPAGSQVTRYERAFNCPTGIEADDRVNLSISGWEGSLQSVQLNCQTLLDRQTGSRVPPLTIDLTEHLQPSNRISITITTSGNAQACLNGAVDLQIGSR